MSAQSLRYGNQSNINYYGTHKIAMSSRTQDVEDSFNKHVISRKERCDMPTTLRFGTVVQILISAISGMLFGIAIEKGRVYEPQMIRNQMLFSNFTMLKMFLTASAVGMISISLLSMIPATISYYEDVLEDFITSLMSKSVAGAAVGGALLGCGMALSGACPGMVFAQVGAVVPDAMLTVAGGLCGAYLFALTEPVVTRLFQPRQTYHYYTLDEFLGCPYFSVALPMAAMMGMGVFAVELFRPWTSEVIQSGSGFFESRAWPPFVAGMLIGSLQIPTILSVKTTLGSSTGYMTLASQILVIKPLQSLLPHLQQFQCGINSWWQVFYLGGAIAGAHLSARASDAIGSVSGVGPWYSFFGGILMIYGSRLAGGCSSGHGLSGMALLMFLSLVAVPSMFAGGISTAVFMKYVLNMEI